MLFYPSEELLRLPARLGELKPENGFMPHNGLYCKRLPLNQER